MASYYIPRPIYFSVSSLSLFTDTMTDTILQVNKNETIGKCAEFWLGFASIQCYATNHVSIYCLYASKVITYKIKKFTTAMMEVGRFGTIL